jgi:hypothetical protein
MMPTLGGRLIESTRSGIPICGNTVEPIISVLTRPSVERFGSFTCFIYLTDCRLQNALTRQHSQPHVVIMVSSGSSAVLQSVGSQINSETAVHIQKLMRKDIEHFADTMRARGLDPSSVRNRGLAGADGVLELAQWIESRATPCFAGRCLGG